MTQGLLPCLKSLLASLSSGLLSRHHGSGRWRRLRRVFTLSSLEYRLLWQSAIALIMVQSGLWLLPFQRVAQLCLHPTPVQLGNTTPTPQQVAWAIERVGQLLHLSCLPRALAAQRLLQHYGHTSQLHIGVCKPSSQVLAAHAWVENATGVIIGQLPDLPSYLPILIQPSAIEAELADQNIHCN